jgi:beta-lactamase class A
VNRGKALNVIPPLVGIALVAAASALGLPIRAHAAPPAAAAVRRALAEAASPEPTASPTSEPSPTPAARSLEPLQAQVAELLQQAGASGGVTLIELSGDAPVAWSLGGDQLFVAASTYKLPLLMEEAQSIATGSSRPTDQLCYQAADQEEGYFSDYDPGACFARGELDRRVGTYSDNTAAHILVRYDGGGDALNDYGRAHGATESAFYDPNLTTSNDLARLWLNEAQGSAGGAAAQAYLYPLLTDTAYEQGIPAGVPPGTVVVHKIGILDGEVNDAALIPDGMHGGYVLTVCTEGAGWPLIASIASSVARFEASARA